MFGSAASLDPKRVQIPLWRPRSAETHPKFPRLYPSQKSGQARVRYLGRDHYLGLYGSRESREACARLLTEVVRELGGTASLSTGMTVSDLILRYWTHAQTYHRRADGFPTGEHVTMRAALKPLRRLYGSTPAAEFRAKHLRLLREEMIRLNWSRRYVNDQVGRVKRMFAWGIAEELIPESVSGSLITVKVLYAGRSAAREKTQVEPVALDVVEATLSHLLPSLPISSAYSVSVVLGSGKWLP